jgi:urea transport system permease protein
MPNVFRWIFSLSIALVALSGRAAYGAELSDDLTRLSAEDRDVAAKAIESIASRGDLTALAVLSALSDGTLRVDGKGNAFVQDGGALKPLSPGAPRAPAGRTVAPLVDNVMRRSLEPSIASLRLTSPDHSVRLGAADDLAKHRNDDLAPVVRKALATEKEADVRKKLALALAQVDLSSADTGRRLSALAVIGDSGDPAFEPDLERLLGTDDRGGFREPNEAVRRAARAALSSIQSRQAIFAVLGHLFYGLSLGSVLLLAALGLAITFGLMRVINMAHGELLMIGAYTTYVIQKLFQEHFPAHADYYLVASIPAAFFVSGFIGMVLERTVVSFLYGRPLETLLATFGISLILVQTVRMIFGAQNVTVANPSWLAGGVELAPDFVLTYSRLAVIAFGAAVVLFVWFVLQRTPLGLHVRAVTQNREMAASMGISTRRVDLWTFGIGSGVAGLGGVALSQLGNVGPELGQGYIVDSFMVVVLGGVGKLAGTLFGALGLGIANKLLEPLAGAVLGKIAVLAFIILFIQRRPQGIFALKGRAAEVA